MASVASQLIEKVTAHAQSNSLEEARDIWADGTYFPNNLFVCGFQVLFLRYFYFVCFSMCVTLCLLHWRTDMGRVCLKIAL